MSEAKSSTSSSGPIRQSNGDEEPTNLPKARSSSGGRQPVKRSETEPNQAYDEGAFDQLIRSASLRRQRSNSLLEEPSSGDAFRALRRQPSVLFALLGDKEVSEPEEIDSLSDGSLKDEITAEESGGHASLEIDDDSKGSDAIAQHSFYDDIDQFDVKDGDIQGNIGNLSAADLGKLKIVQRAMKGFISLNDAKNKLTDRIDNKMALGKVLQRLDRRRQKIEKIMSTAPFQRRMDKLAYVFGTNMVVLFTYCIAKYPDDFFYTFAIGVMALMLFHRYYTFWFNGWHMYLVDFCYVANFMTLFFVMLWPKSQWMMTTCFVFGNGTLATGILAFRNSLVYHKIDFLASLMTHCVPMILTLHIRWYTIPNQAHLPEEEQRFTSLPDTSSWAEFANHFFIMPLTVYFIWLTVYGVINFICTDKVRDYTHDSVYRTFTTNKGLTQMLPSWLAWVPMPIVFLFCHFLFYFVTHCMAVCLYHSFYLNMIAAFCLMQWSVVQGACYYMDYFSKRYEQQLAKLVQLEGHVVAPPLKRQSSTQEPPKEADSSQECKKQQ